MPDFTATLVDQHAGVSPGFVDTLIQARRQELFTGLMRLRYPTSDAVAFSFLGGVQQKLYRFDSEQTEAIPRQAWSKSLDRPGASVAFLSLSVEGLRLARVVHESPVLRTEQLDCSQQELAGCISQWSLDRSPAILHIQDSSQERIFLIAGNSTPIIEGLSFIDGAGQFTINDATFPASMPSAAYHVTRYVSDGSHDVWQEYELRFAFSPLIRMLLNRFSELAGRILAERLCQQLTNWIQQGGWNLQITINGITNHHYFESVQDAQKAYLEVLHRFSYEASPAIGSRMADGLGRDIMLKLDPHRRALLKHHIYDNYYGTGAPEGRGGRTL